MLDLLHRQIVGGAGVAGLGGFQRVAVAQFRLLDLLEQFGGVQRGDHIALFHRIAHLHVDGGHLVQLGRIRHRDRGILPGLDGAVDRHAVSEGGLFQRGGADKRIGQPLRVFHHIAHHKKYRNGDDQKHHQHDGQYLVAQEPVFGLRLHGRVPLFTCNFDSIPDRYVQNVKCQESTHFIKLYHKNCHNTDTKNAGCMVQPAKFYNFMSLSSCKMPSPKGQARLLTLLEKRKLCCAGASGRIPTRRSLSHTVGRCRLPQTDNAAARG